MKFIKIFPVLVLFLISIGIQAQTKQPAKDTKPKAPVKKETKTEPKKANAAPAKKAENKPVAKKEDAKII